MKRALILIALAAATAGCQQASASEQAPAPDPRTQLRTPDRFMARSPETRERIQPGRIKCQEPVASVPC
ncbi:MAG TPA: hypothetical protein VEZ41_09975 [Allosphingosinicella sp.]|nr:hypothetical protein [Allosphingosinicella sp.]